MNGTKGMSRMDKSKLNERVFCSYCGRSMIRDEIALNMKLIGPEPEEFLCLSCLSEEIGVPVRELKLKIEDFRESGCTLFTD